MTVEGMAEKILALITERVSGVSYVETVNHVGNEARGDLALELRPNTNLIVWDGVSQTFAGAMNLLLEGRKIKYRSTSMFVYLADGATLRLPIAKRMPKAGGFKKPRWVPVVFSLCKAEGGR